MTYNKYIPNLTFLLDSLMVLIFIQLTFFLFTKTEKVL